MEDFETSWPKVFQQFPLYVSILHLLKIVTGFGSHLIVIAFAVVIFGVFSISLFISTQRLLHLSKWQGVFLTLFVTLQIALLRTAMNNHRDIFALSTMFFTISLIYREKGCNDIKWPSVIIAVVLTAATVCSDGMIGSLLVVTLIIYSVISKKKIVILCALVAISFLAYAISLPDNPIRENIEANSNYFSQSTPTIKGSTEPLNLLLIFVTINGFLIPTGIIGFRVLKINLLKIPLLVCIPLSFSWIMFPDIPTLVAHRWTVLFGIFFSIFASYGIIHLADRLHSVKKEAAILCGVIAISVIFGFTYTSIPKDGSFIFYGASENQLRNFLGIAMQPDRDHINNLKSAISWINKNTETDALIVGSSLFRGWMQTYLADNRVYNFSLNSEKIVLDVSNQHKDGYLIIRGEKYPKEIENSILDKVYSEDDFTLFRIKHNENIIPTISWINKNTESNSIIFGKKYLINWMDSLLKDNRRYKSSPCEYNCLSYWENQIAALKNQPQKHGYIIAYNSKTSEEFINNESLIKIYSSDKFTIFRISDVH